jgi:hypothetical protein
MCRGAVRRAESKALDPRNTPERGPFELTNVNFFGLIRAIVFRDRVR